MLTWFERLPRSLSIGEPDNVLAKCDSTSPLGFIQVFVVVLEDEGHIENMRCLALERAIPRIRLVESVQIRGVLEPSGQFDCWHEEGDV